MNHDSQASSVLSEELFTVNLTDEQIARFWSRVEKLEPDECWPWRGQLDRKGYAKWRLKCKALFSCGYKDFFGSRISYFLNYGAFASRLNVCHSCDKPICVNPAHLFLGTQKDNMHDCIKKGRYLYPDAGIVTEEIVRKVRQLCQNKIPQRRIAEQLNLSQACISLIHSGKRWKHII